MTSARWSAKSSPRAPSTALDALRARQAEAVVAPEDARRQAAFSAERGWLTRDPRPPPGRYEAIVVTDLAGGYGCAPAAPAWGRCDLRARKGRDRYPFSRGSEDDRPPISLSLVAFCRRL